MPNAWATVDLDAVAANIEALCSLVAPAAVCAVVKADGYGHGAVPVARAATEAGAAWLAVANVAEGEAVRGAGIDIPVLVLSEPEIGDVGRLVDADLRATVISDAGVDAAAAAAARRGVVQPVHLKVDTGMHRVGVDPADAVEMAMRIAEEPALELEAVWTHLAVADEPDDPFTAVQLTRYQGVLDALADRGVVPTLRHAANSAGAIAHPGARFDLVRCGIATYGIAPSPELADRVGLRPALSLAARVVQVRRIPAGDALSYGLRHRFDHDATVATVAIGYADGVRRDLHRLGGVVLLGGRRCPIVGTVTMDQIMVECGDVGVGPGDSAVLIGRQGSECITADEIAGLTGTIPYEVVCGVGPRVERRWVRS
ncbi:MAG: alanine racemase [Acidimicrobiales bacterium]